MVKHVSSFPELLSTPFANGVNALCWSRSLPGDYAEVVKLLGPGEGIVALDEDLLRSLKLSAYGLQAVEVMLSDLSLLRQAGRDPVLNIVYSYPKDDDPICPTDVFSWHVDSAPIESDTWLCTYHGAPSEGLLNECALRKVDDPVIRAQLRNHYGLSAEALAKEDGQDDRTFTAWLADNHYDLHYMPRTTSETPSLPRGLNLSNGLYSFGTHNLWRISCAWPGSPVPPCVHRAPATLPDQPTRLLLIS